MAPCPDIYLTFREIPDGSPAYIIRQPGKTLLICNPCSPRLDITAHMIDNLTTEECNAIRAAYGLPPVGTHSGDFVTEGPAFLYVPEEVRLAGEPPLQGGAELDRRAAEGTLTEELVALHAERMNVPFRRQARKAS